jgi:splicing factor 3B subunit 2
MSTLPFNYFIVQEDSDEEGDKESKISRKKYKALHRLSIAELKQLVKRPDVVEVWDVTASDPRLLVYLKSYRNSVPVPRHWCNKRKYLQGKRGIEKAPFQLPAFIEATGIAKLRQAYEDKQSEQSAKQRSRAASRPKMSKMDIDYQVLHDAFFKFQTKPRMTTHGDLYYEGKEFEVRMKEKRPGTMSDELKAALGMPTDGIPVPPPWLINMQRYGPPPSYPNLKIPGLNAPIPSGAQFGYHPGGWGKPPVDEFGRPIYGDVFGTAETTRGGEDDTPLEKKWWGEIVEEDVEDEDEDDEEEEDAGEEPADMESGISSVTSGLATPSDGLASIELRKSSMSGLETPESSSAGAEFNVRKNQTLYTVIQQEETKVAGHDLVGSSFKYNMQDPTAAAAAAAKKDRRHVDLIKSQATAGVEVTIDASELDTMDETMLQEKYEHTVSAQRREQREDVSDVFAEESRKRKKDTKGKDGKSKKYKDYEF